MFFLCLRVAVCCLFFAQNALAWWGRGEENQRYNQRSYSDTIQKFDYSSAASRKLDFSSRINFSSSFSPQYFFPARNNFFENPMYRSLISVKQNGGDRDFFTNRIAPNTTISDLASGSLGNGTKFESYSHTSRTYDAYSISNVKSSGDQVQSFTRNIARGGWNTQEQISGIQYGADKLPQSLQVEVQDIAGNKLVQRVMDLEYRASNDANRLKDLQTQAANNAEREGFYAWRELNLQLQDWQQPAQMVAQSFVLEVETPQGKETLKFSDVQWNKDRIVGFVVDVVGAGLDLPAAQMQVTPVLDNNGKIESLKVQLTEGRQTQELTLEGRDGLKLSDEILKVFRGINPLSVMGSGSFVVAGAAVPPASVALDKTGLLQDGPEFKRDYGFEKDNASTWFSAGILTRGNNALKAQIAQIEQTDANAVRRVLWSNSLKDFTKNELQGSLNAITEIVTQKLPQFEGTQEVKVNDGFWTSQNDTAGEIVSDAAILKTDTPLKLEFKEGKIMSPNTFTNDEGEKFSDAVFVIDREQNLKLFQAKDSKGKILGNDFISSEEWTQNQTKSSQNFWQKTSAIASKIVTKIFNFIGNILSLKPIEKEQSVQHRLSEDARRAAKLPISSSVRYYESAQMDRVSENPASADFNIRNTYRALPLLGSLPVIGKLWFAQKDRGEDVAITFHKPAAEFTQQVKNAKSIDLFVHGYNVNAEKAADFRDKMFSNLKKISSYINVNAGVSWSGDVGNSFIGKTLFFKRAVESANLSWQALKTAETFLHQQNSEIKINAVTHSLGARPILNAANNGVKFNTVILLLPAIGQNSFERGGEFEKALQNINRLVVVCSKRQEMVFGISYRVMMLQDSLGHRGPNANFTHPKITFVDGTRANNNQSKIDIRSHFDYQDRETLELIANYLREDK